MRLTNLPPFRRGAPQSGTDVDARARAVAEGPTDASGQGTSTVLHESLQDRARELHDLVRGRGLAELVEVVDPDD